jgi:hypothetical protein
VPQSSEAAARLRNRGKRPAAAFLAAAQHFGG